MMYLGLDPDQDEKFEAVLRPETLVVDCGWTFALRGTVYAYTLTRTAGSGRRCRHLCRDLARSSGIAGGGRMVL